ncbi:late competence development ComFB family protein [Desulforamulus ruminis]|uniref:Late competence development protein ComFB n=1 Tax=Desulforamulus ruminis (strain ATCC 23193 / DSM 2154 / NCIMB 8452 / DL) TaxID=696281 RepID=F6DRU1_DESRL|nr:late competence development ComFB family protein [Desulforamulus ruminis]AEG59852.1 Late competence development protein ComFB [Desulforamulus ruminis DSM 2154]
MNEKFISNNVMEQIVDCKLKGLMELSKMCTCERCRADVRALALNDLPPRYVVTRVGEVMTQCELLTLQRQINITISIMRAIKIVSQNPRHSDEI